MASEAVKLPVIDFSSQDLKPGTHAWESVKDEVKTALEDFGCFQALYDKVPGEIRNALFGTSAELFDLPLENKVRNTSNIPMGGYIAPNPGRPLYESFGVQEPTLPEKVQSFTDAVCPQGNSKFSKTIQSYSELLSELDKTVRRMILESLGLEKYMDEHMDSTSYACKLMKYKEPQNNENKIGLQAHTDKNVVTILDQIQTKGLEVLTKDGQWIEVNFSPNSFLVLIGESFHAWTNGRVHSAFHRVVITGNDPRYSAGLFSNIKPDYIVKAPEELVDEEHPLLYKPFEVSGYLAFYANEGGHKYKSPLKAFCGV